LSRRGFDHVIEELRRWGVAEANRYAIRGSDRGGHALERARDMAPGTRERALQKLVGRDGTSRRRRMAQSVGIESMRLLPMWAVDPVRFSDDGDKPRDIAETAVDMGIPDDLLWVASALASMRRQFPIRAEVCRTEFTVSASRRIKAKMVQEGYGGRFTERQYRTELEKGIEWFRASRHLAA
jgi:hypothetical protein